MRRKAPREVDHRHAARESFGASLSEPSAGRGEKHGGALPRQLARIWHRRILELSGGAREGPPAVPPSRPPTCRSRSSRSSTRGCSARMRLSSEAAVAARRRRSRRVRVCIATHSYADAAARSSPSDRRRGSAAVARPPARRSAAFGLHSAAAKQTCRRARPALHGTGRISFFAKGTHGSQQHSHDQAGADALKRELKRLKSVERPRIVQRHSRVDRDHGDLSENAEYHAAKEKQSARRRPHPDAGRPPGPRRDHRRGQARRRAGGLRRDRQARGHRLRPATQYTIVGEDEADSKKGRISITSPIARGLVGREVGDSVTIRTPGGEREYEILEVSVRRVHGRRRGVAVAAQADSALSLALSPLFQPLRFATRAGVVRA